MAEDKPTLFADGTVSPLAEADPNSINELIEKRIGSIFNKPPLEITEQGLDNDMSLVVRFYREQRQRFATESKGTKPVTARKAAPKSVKEALDLSALE